MLETKDGVDDGEIYPREFKLGKTYDVGPELGRAFVGEKWAEPVKKKKKDKDDGGKKKKDHANKMKEPAENK